MPEDHYVGFWGPVTSNIDWCESNYEVTYYIAEFWNTVSNFGLIFLSIFGAIEGWRGKQIEFHYIVPFLAMFAVGIGSWLFHMSLVYHLQLFDEFPMIWGTASIIYALECADKSWKFQNFRLAVFLFFCCLVSTLVYVMLDARLIFEGTYGAMVIYSAFLLGKWSYRDGKGSFKLFLLSVSTYGTAFVFWISDRIFCKNLQGLRQNLHPALQPFTQFHAIWHILVGYGAHFGLMLVLRARFTKLAKSHQLGFRYGIFPYYTPATATSSLKSDAEDGIDDIAVLDNKINRRQTRKTDSKKKT